TIYMPLSAENTLTLAACRQRPDFSDREKTMLDLMRPHVATAWKRALRDNERNSLGNDQSPRMLSAGGMQAFGLTPRETEVLRWISEGKTNPEISVIIGASTATVKTHVERILGKLHCETRTAAARTALEVWASN
ncbi:MAG: helix-turn-helix transcriptional regulator, partial [Verrucomicrobiota bacterium]|nr:helix-turn-helix transcriptional regulator [Verrucomicrobiota bacterium]